MGAAEGQGVSIQAPRICEDSRESSRTLSQRSSSSGASTSPCTINACTMDNYEAVPRTPNPCDRSFRSSIGNHLSESGATSCEWSWNMHAACRDSDVTLGNLESPYRAHIVGSFLPQRQTPAFPQAATDGPIRAPHAEAAVRREPPHHGHLRPQPGEVVHGRPPQAVRVQSGPRARTNRHRGKRFGRSRTFGGAF